MDPRYDEAYQRGFDGELAKRVDAPEPTLAPTELAAASVPLAPAPPEVTAVPDDVGDDDLDEPRNPWLIALWVVGGVLIVTPLIAIAGLARMYTSEAAVQDAVPRFILYQFVPLVLPWLVGGGLIAIIAAIAATGIRWELRRRRPLR